MKRIFSALGRWLGWLRSFLVNGLFIALLVIYLFIIFGNEAEVPQHAALIIDPSGQIVEELELPSPGSLPLQLNISSPKQTRLHDMLAAIKRAETDDRITLIILKLDNMAKTSLPKLQELRQAIMQFKRSDKMVIAIGPNYSQSQYYLAASADQLFLNPLGMVAMEGFSVYRNYIKDALDKLNVDVHVFRTGKYKSAIEPLLRNNMSDEDKQANQALLKVLWSSYKQDVAEMRQLKATRLQTLLDQPATFLAAYGGDAAALFKAEGLVDTLASHSSIEQYIAAAMGAGSGQYDSIDFRQYLSATASEVPAAKAQRVGVITASGMIMDGKQPPGKVGSATMLAMLNRAKLDPNIKAVVLRIDSPGGSAQASEAIRDAIVHVQQAGKPVVVSMASMAASGGYWMAAPADQIWASPTTITGSIGAFGILPNVRRSLDKMGIHSDGFGTTAIAGGIRPDRPLPPQLAQVMQMSIQHIYQRFLHVVGSGRKLSPEQVSGLAEGRVWSGIDAHRLGLVDSLGSFRDAIEAAAKLAGIEADFSPVWIKPPLSMREIILLKLFGNADTLAAHIASAIAQRLTLLGGASITGPLAQELMQMSEWLGLTEGRPGIFAMCNLRVE